MPRDERKGEPQSGDLVIELRNGAPVVYTQPEIPYPGSVPEDGDD